MKTFFLSLICALSVYTSTKGQSGVSEMKLTDDTYTFKLKVIQYFPFIGIRINDIEGLAMFDTGNEERLVINRNRVKEPAGTKIGVGAAGSGQTFDVYRLDTVDSIILGNGLKYQHVQHLLSFDIGFIETITPDMLGFIGYNFFSGYLFKLDYANGLLTFYKDTPERKKEKDFLKNENIIAVLDFETRQQPNQPVIKCKIGGVDFTGSFDTGTKGTISLSDSLQKELSKRGVLKLSDSTPEVLINEIELQGNVKVNAVHADYFPQIKTQGSGAIGMNEENTLTIGYSFLSQFKTVWDYEQKKIYLLKK